MYHAQRCSIGTRIMAHNCSIFISTFLFWFNALLGFGGIGKICVSLGQYFCLFSSACSGSSSCNQRTAAPKGARVGWGVRGCPVEVSIRTAHRLADLRLRRKRKVPQQIGSGLCTTRNITSTIWASEALLHLRQALRFLLLVCMEAAGQRPQLGLLKCSFQFLRTSTCGKW